MPSCYIPQYEKLLLYDLWIWALTRVTLVYLGPHTSEKLQIWCEKEAVGLEWRTVESPTNIQILKFNNNICWLNSIRYLTTKSLFYFAICGARDID